MPRGGKRKGAGRKPRIEGEPSENVVPIRCTDPELSRWEKFAKGDGKPLIDWIRDTLNAAQK